MEDNQSKSRTIWDILSKRAEPNPGSSNEERIYGFCSFYGEKRPACPQIGGMQAEENNPCKKA